MKATCPKDETHKRFITVATVTEDWIVDSWGDFLDDYGESNGDVIHHPDPGNIWTCAECGEEAKVER